MNYIEAKELFSKINIELSKDMYDKFSIYEEELISWNEKINLTTILEDEEIWLKHFLDSCTISPHIPHNSSVIDIGTGAGFPGIPAKIIDEDINLTLLDSLNKRIEFLKDVCDKTRFNNVDFVHGRAEDFGKDILYREKFDIACARAVANLSTLCEYCLPFVKVGGKFICMKGKCIEEIENAKNAILKLGGKISKTENFTLPNTDMERTIIIIEKVSNTPKIYPRKAGTPSKNPIC